MLLKNWKKIPLLMTCILVISFSGQSVASAEIKESPRMSNNLVMNELIESVDQILVKSNNGTLLVNSDQLLDIIDSKYEQLQTIEYFSPMSKEEIYQDISNQILKFNEEPVETNSTISYSSSYFPDSTKYWWGYGYRFYSSDQARAYADNVSSKALIGATATAIKSALFGPGAPLITGTGILWSAYRITLAEDVRKNADYHNRLALDVSWVAIYKLYSF